MTDKDTISKLEHLAIRMLALPFQATSGHEEEAGRLRKDILSHFESKNPLRPTLQDELNKFMEDTGSALGFSAYRMNSKLTHTSVECDLVCYKCSKHWTIKAAMVNDIKQTIFDLTKSRIDHVCEPRPTKPFDPTGWR